MSRCGCRRRAAGCSARRSAGVGAMTAADVVDRSRTRSWVQANAVTREHGHRHHHDEARERPHAHAAVVVPLTSPWFPLGADRHRVVRRIACRSAPAAHSRLTPTGPPPARQASQQAHNDRPRNRTERARRVATMTTTTDLRAGPRPGRAPGARGERSDGSPPRRPVGPPHPALARLAARPPLGASGAARAAAGHRRCSTCGTSARRARQQLLRRGGPGRHAVVEGAAVRLAGLRRTSSPSTSRRPRCGSWGSPGGSSGSTPGRCSCRRR